MKVFTNERELYSNYAGLLLEKLTFRKLLGEIKYSFLHQYQLVSGDGKEHDFLFVNTIKRDDHCYYFNLVFEQCKYDKGFLEWKIKKSLNFVTISNWFRFLPHIKELKKLPIPKDSVRLDYDANCEIIKMPSLMRWVLYTRLIRNIGIKKDIAKFNWANTKFLVTLYDIGEPEHFILLDAKKNCLKTIVTDHGIFPPVFNYKDCNCYNIWKDEADYILSYGKAVSDVFKKYSPHIIPIECGAIHLKQSPLDPMDDVIAIVADIHENHKQNVEMIKIVEEYALEHNKKIYIRLHPGDNEREYNINQSCSVFRKDTDNAGVIVACTTSMIFTYIAIGRKVLQYKSTLLYYTLPDSFTFDSINTFTEKMEKINSLNFFESSNFFIDSIAAESEKKFQKAFDDIYTNTVYKYITTGQDKNI